MNEEETEVDARLTTREDTAFLEAFDRHAEAVYAYLARRAGSAESGTLLTEVWLRAFASRASYRGDWADARPWLYGVARNTLRMHWRALAREQPREVTAFSDPWPEVEARLDAKALGPLLRRALKMLPGDEREILLLVSWEELSPTEAAVVLGIPPGTARSRLHRARLSLRDLLVEGPKQLSLHGDVPEEM